MRLSLSHCAFGLGLWGISAPGLLVVLVILIGVADLDQLRPIYMPIVNSWPISSLLGIVCGGFTIKKGSKKGKTGLILGCIGLLLFILLYYGALSMGQL